MCKVCLALQVLLLACWTLNDSLLVAQANLTSAFGHQGGGVDHSDDRRQREDRQFTSTKQENPSKEIVRYRDEFTRAFLFTPNLNSFHRNVKALTKITNSFNNNLSRKKRAQKNCVLDGGEMFGPGTPVTFKSLSTTLHVQANKLFKFDIDVDIRANFDKQFTVESESLGISREIEWNSIDIELSSYRSFLQNWKLEVKHGDKVRNAGWQQLIGSEINSMTITVTDCIGWYHGVTRHRCSSPTTMITSLRPTAPTPQRRTTPGTTSPTSPTTMSTSLRPAASNPQRRTTPGTSSPIVSSEMGWLSTPVAPSHNPSSCEERERVSVDHLYWLLVLPLVAVVAAAFALGWLMKRNHYERKALVIEAADQPRISHKNIIPIHDSNNVPACDSNDVWLNPACGTGTWSPSPGGYLCPIQPASQKENIYDDLDEYNY